MESVSEVSGKLYWGPTKTYQQRTVVLPPFLVEELVDHLDVNVAPESGGLIFTSRDGGPLRHSNFFHRVWAPAVSASDLPSGITIHDLRHTCASLLIAAGANPKSIQAHLGHSSITVTFDRYGHLFPADTDALARRLELVRSSSDGLETAWRPLRLSH